MSIPPLPTTHIDIWNNLIAVLLLPGIDPTIRATALQFLTLLNEQGTTGPSIETADRALEWLRYQFTNT